MNYQRGNYLKIKKLLLIYIFIIINFLYSINIDEAQFNLAYKLFSQKKYKEAYKEFNNIVNKYPESKYLYRSLIYSAKCLYYLNDYNNALSIYKSLENKVNNEIDNRLLKYGLAETYFKLKKWSNAIKYFKDFINYFPDSPVIPSALYFLALSYENNGETLEAMYTYKELVEKYPKSTYYNQAANKIIEFEAPPKIMEEMNIIEYKTQPKIQKEKFLTNDIFYPEHQFYPKQQKEKDDLEKYVIDESEILLEDFTFISNNINNKIREVSTNNLKQSKPGLEVKITNTKIILITNYVEVTNRFEILTNFCYITNIWITTNLIEIYLTNNITNVITNFELINYTNMFILVLTNIYWNTNTIYQTYIETQYVKTIDSNQLEIDKLEKENELKQKEIERYKELIELRAKLLEMKQKAIENKKELLKN